MLAELINRTCTITTGVEADDFGIDPAPAPGAVVTTVCELQQRNRTEPGDSGEVSVSDWVLFLLPDETITTADRIEVDGEVFEVVGEPWVARNPISQADSHIEATVRRTAGAVGS